MSGEYSRPNFLHYKGLRFTKLAAIPDPVLPQPRVVADSINKARKEMEYARAMNKPRPDYYALPGGMVADEEEIIKTVDNWQGSGIIERMGMYGLLVD
jgi:hypothetical protein